MRALIVIWGITISTSIGLTNAAYPAAEENCILLTPEKEKAINDTINKIATFLGEMQEELDGIDIRLLEVDIDRHSDQEREDKDVKLKIIVNYCDEIDDVDDTVITKRRYHRKHHKSASKFPKIDDIPIYTDHTFLVSKTKGSNGKDDDPKETAIEDSSIELRDSTSVDTVSDTAGDESTVIEINQEIATGTNEPKNNHAKKGRRHHKNKHNKPTDDTYISGVTKNFSFDDILTKPETPLIKNDPGLGTRDASGRKKQKSHHKRKHRKNIENNTTNNNAHATSASQNAYDDSTIPSTNEITTAATESVLSGEKNRKYTNQKPKDDHQNNFKFIDIFKNLFDTAVNDDPSNSNHPNLKKEKVLPSVDDGDTTAIESILPEKRHHKQNNHKPKDDPGSYQFADIFNSIFKTAVNEEPPYPAYSNPKEVELMSSADESDTVVTERVFPEKRNHKHKNHKRKDNHPSKHDFTDTFNGIFNKAINENPSNPTDPNSKGVEVIQSAGKSDTKVIAGIVPEQKRLKHNSHNSKDNQGSYQFTDIFNSILNTEVNEEPLNPPSSNSKEVEITNSAYQSEPEKTNKHKNKPENNRDNDQFTDIFKSIFNRAVIEEPSNPTYSNSKEVDVIYDNKSVVVEDGTQIPEAKNHLKNKRPRHLVDDEKVTVTRENYLDKSDTVFIMTSPLPHYSNINDDESNSKTDDNLKPIDKKTQPKKRNHHKRKQHGPTAANTVEISESSNYSEDKNSSSDDGSDQIKEDSITIVDDNAVNVKKHHRNQRNDKNREEIDDPNKVSVEITTDKFQDYVEEILEGDEVSNEEILRQLGKNRSHHLTADDFRRYLEENDDGKEKCVCLHGLKPDMWFP